MTKQQRAKAVAAACADEIARFNAAVAGGVLAAIRVSTYPTPLRVTRCSPDFWVHTPDANCGFGSDWAIANDGRWADLLEQAGVRRNPLFR